MSNVRIRLGISACLRGERVRSDGGHKRDHHIRRCGVACLPDQVYLRPPPVGLMLRHHV